ncbi:MAG: alpha/beta hydrolase [Acidobacteria bacterium]|nr:alpha/beta hydrolase [Acidobacteriota bacterium]MCI0661613.1 alpha/beta hydrolase [Acidobacteriota bacterium]
MKRIKVNGAELAYRDEGSGEPIVFLHAFPLNQTLWDGQLAAFASDYRVITFDWRGFGHSTLGDRILTMDVFADDLTGLLQELSIERAIICGLSMGGYAAFAFYRKAPERVSALILADTRSTPDNEEGKRGRLEMAELVRNNGAPALVDIMIPRLFGETTLRNNPQVAERVKAMIESSQPEGVAQALLAMAGRVDSTDMLPQISCPTLIIVGNEDKLTPPDESEKMSQAIPGSILEIILNAGHLTNIEQPESFNRSVSDFLSSRN